MVEPERVRVLKDGEPRQGADYVLYWMQASQRTLYNHALAEAVSRANDLGLPVVVCMGVQGDYPEANARHYMFMLQGVRDVASALEEKGIAFILRVGSAPKLALKLGEKAALIVCDRSYLREPARWRSWLAGKAACPVIQVESEAVVPVDAASDKMEHAARTLRPKLHRRMDDFIAEMRVPSPKISSRGLKISGEDVSDPEKLLKKLNADPSVPPVEREGGERAAQNRLDAFLEDGLSRYADGRSDPLDDAASGLSEFLHYGQISPVQIAHRARSAPASESRASFIEELIVRRELSFNFVRFNPDYDSWSGAAPDWAKTTLDQHKDDPRPEIFTHKELEAAKTGDDAWDAAMGQMRREGRLNNAIRMYWGKKIIEWTNTPDHAWRTALALNNRWFIDGRDPNSFSNVAWIFGRHDRPFQERAILGKVRPYTTAALKRKFDLKAWIKSQSEDGQTDLF